jgi:hypothetical protein
MKVYALHIDPPTGSCTVGQTGRACAGFGGS